MIKLAVIGAGSHSALHHGPACQALQSRAHLTAVCDLNQTAAENYRARFGFARAYTDYKQMIAAESPDALIAVTPTARTKAICLDLLSFGLPLLIEKPVGVDAREAGEVLAAATKSAARVMVSLNRRFAPMIAEGLAWLKTNTAGRPPRFMRAAMLRHDRHDPDFLTATAIHALDIILAVMGQPRRVEAVGTFGRTSGWARLEFAEGAGAEFLIAPNCGCLSETYDIIGDDYCVQADYFRELRIHDRGKPVLQRSLDLQAPVEKREGAVAELAHFLDAVEGRAEFSPSLSDSLQFALAAGTIADQFGAGRPR